MVLPLWTIAPFTFNSSIAHLQICDLLPKYMNSVFELLSLSLIESILDFTSTIHFSVVSTVFCSSSLELGLSFCLRHGRQPSHWLKGIQVSHLWGIKHKHCLWRLPRRNRIGHYLVIGWPSWWRLVCRLGTISPRWIENQINNTEKYQLLLLFPHHLCVT